MKRSANYLLIILALAFLGGCALFDKSLPDTKIGDGKILNVDIKGILDIIPNKIASCNKEGQLITPNCLVAIADGIVSSQSTSTPEDRAVKEALKELGFVNDEEEYKCCKGLGIAGTFIYNRAGGQVGKTILEMLK